MVSLIDIMATLLLVFMLTAPQMYRGIDVDLPRSSVNTIKQEQRIMLTVDRERNIFVDEERVRLKELETAIRQKRRADSDITVYFKADKEVPYGTVIKVMDIVKKIGIDKLGMITEPLKEVK